MPESGMLSVADENGLLSNNERRHIEAWAIRNNVHHGNYLAVGRRQ